MVFTYPQPAATLENLSRLASKPGVQSTLILSKADGSIIRSTGLLAASSSSQSDTPVVENNFEKKGPQLANDAMVGKGSADEPDLASTENSAQKVARMVHNFVASANSFTEGMNRSDDVRLLRLRTRKNEIVIVPGKKSLILLYQSGPLD
ncbi:hypothetical protein ACLMJK_001000 [Lecanora helva]